MPFSMVCFISFKCIRLGWKEKEKVNLTHTIRFPLPKHIQSPYSICIDIQGGKTKTLFCTQFLYFISVINLKESLICLMLIHTQKSKRRKSFHVHRHFTCRQSQDLWSTKFFWKWFWKMWIHFWLCTRP